MNRFTQKLTAFAFLLGSSFALASDPDLMCYPRDIVDAGFAVRGDIVENGALNLKVTALSGWGGDEEKFNGPAILVSERVDDKCVFKVVDNKDNPQTVVSMIIGGEDILEKLNGEDQTTVVDGEAQNIMNKLSCVGSKKFMDLLTSTCQ